MSREKECLRHLDILSSSSDPHVFQIKSECSGRQGEKRKENRFGTYQDLAPWLLEAQEDGCAVFVQIQDGTSARKTGIKRARAFFLDFDTAVLPPLPKTPSLVLQTKNGWHVYYSIMPTNDLKTWQSMQNGLVRALGADPKCTLLNQKARLAGFDHQKQFDPYRVRVRDSKSTLIYTLDDFENFLEPEEEVPEPIEIGAYETYCGTWDFPLLRFWLNRLLSTLRGAVEGNRFNTLKNVAFQMGAYATVGLDAKIAITKMRQIVAGWKEFDHDDGFHTITAMFNIGFEHAKKHPPHPPAAQVLAFERRDRRSEYEDRITANVATLAIDGRIDVGTIMQTFAEWPEAFSGDGSARRGIAKHLRTLGYQERRVKNMRFYVQNDGAKPPPVCFLNLDALSKQRGSALPQTPLHTV